MFPQMPLYTTLSSLDTMIIPLLAILAFSKLANWLPRNFGGQASPLTFTVTSADVPHASSTK